MSKRQAVVILAVGVFCYAPLNARSEVLGIRIYEVAGDLGIESATFFPVGTSGAHFSLDTLYVLERAGSTGAPDPLRNLWWDLGIEVAVTPNMATMGAMIAIDKDVINRTPFRWTDFHMTLGMGFGDNFMESNESDLLFFKPNPPPMEKSGAFPNPPMTDEPIDPDSLWWGPDPNFPGVPPGGPPAIFWLGINVPASKFEPNPTGGPAIARFTLRQHATIPEPSGLVLAAGLAVAAAWARRQAG